LLVQKLTLYRRAEPAKIYLRLGFNKLFLGKALALPKIKPKRLGILFWFAQVWANLAPR
jgi:hypothetical protein